jgi:hypothetical protein
MKAIPAFRLVACSHILFYNQASVLLSKQTLMKSNAQLRRNDQDDDVPPPPPIPVGIPDVASSSQNVLPPQPDVSYSQIMEALVAIQVGHEFYAALHVIHAAVHLSHAARGSLN